MKGGRYRVHCEIVTRLGTYDGHADDLPAGKVHIHVQFVLRPDRFFPGVIQG